MKIYIFSLLVAAGFAAAGSAQAQSTITFNGDIYELTTSSYTTTGVGATDDANWVNVVHTEFGSGAVVANFATLQTDVAATSGGNAALWTFLSDNAIATSGTAVNADILLEATAGNASLNGGTSFMELHPTGNPGSFGSFGAIAGASTPEVINLGRYHGITGPILAEVGSATPVPEPTTIALAGLGLAGLVAFRRRK